MKIFIDTAPLIYLIEGIEDFADSVEKQLRQWIEAEENLATSTLTLLELLVVPMKQENKHLVQKYRALLQDILSEPLISLSESISEMAAQIRGVTGFKTPDSIQLATALYAGADLFYTNDKRLSKFSDIKILTIKKG
jgi:predicted nucleic acid-binding protein